MNKAILAVLLMAAFNVSATNNNPPNECGNHGNNCQPENGNGGNSSSSSNATGTGVGIGLGVGVGGSGGNGGAGGDGGSGGSGGNAHGGSAVGVGGSGGDSSSAVVGSGNSHNANTAKGGDASQGQHQGQAQSSRNDNTNVSGAKSVAQMASENTNRVNASSANDNRSSASGNQTAVTNNIGGDSTLVERNAPPVFLGALTPTSCGGGFNAGGSSRDGAGAFGIQWVGKECRMRMIGDRYHALGMVDTACEVYKATKGFKDAAKANPKLRDIDCTIKPAPAPAPVLVAPELAPRIPRG